MNTNDQSTGADASLEDVLCREAYKVKDRVCEALRKKDFMTAALEMNVFFGKSFSPSLYRFQPDKDELVKQLNKFMKKSELYTWLPFKNNVFPAIGIVFQNDLIAGDTLPGAYRTLYLLYKYKHLIPVESWKHFMLNDMICQFYTRELKNQLQNEFGGAVEAIFNPDSSINAATTYQQALEYTKKHISADYGILKDEIEAKEFPAVILAITLLGTKAFAVRDTAAA